MNISGPDLDFEVRPFFVKSERNGRVAREHFERENESRFERRNADRYFGGGTRRPAS